MRPACENACRCYPLAADSRPCPRRGRRDGDYGRIRGSPRGLGDVTWQLATTSTRLPATQGTRTATTCNPPRAQPPRNGRSAIEERSATSSLCEGEALERPASKRRRRWYGQVAVFEARPLDRHRRGTARERRCAFAQGRRASRGRAGRHRDIGALRTSSTPGAGSSKAGPARRTDGAWREERLERNARWSVARQNGDLEDCNHDGGTRSASSSEAADKPQPAATSAASAILRRRRPRPTVSSTNARSLQRG